MKYFWRRALFFHPERKRILDDGETGFVFVFHDYADDLSLSLSMMRKVNMMVAIRIMV